MAEKEGSVEVVVVETCVYVYILLKYKELHGDVSVKHDFVVPKDRYVCVFVCIQLYI
jgi:hypothetical protein